MAMLVLAAATLAGVFLARAPFPLASGERLYEAVAFHLFAPVQPPDDEVVIIGITEDTLARFPYRSPVDRAFLARVIDGLADAGVAGIGLDVLLDGPTEPGKDAALRTAIRRTDVPIVVITLGAGTPELPEARRFLATFLSGVRTGYANLARDRFDDIVRQHVPVDPSTGTRSLPAELAASVGAPVPRYPFPIIWRRSSQERSFFVYPAESVKLLPHAWLAHKVALVGSLLPGTDEHRTLASAFSARTFGVEIHAQVLSQLLARRALPLPLIPWSEILTNLGMAALGLVAASRLAGYALATVLAAAAALFLAGCVCIYAAGGPLVPVFGPVLAAAVSGGMLRAWLGRGERRDRRMLHMLFSRFVSAQVADELLRERDLFLAGGRPRPQLLTATVLFADVAGFTSICERLQPEPLIAWLDLYIDTMVGHIAAHGGVVLRFVGDGILAVFGAPIPQREEAAIAADARNAARCALAMETAMSHLNHGWRAAGLPEAGLRVGLHTGRLVAGSLGTGPHMEYCLLGDTANVGARLEQLGKEYGSGPYGCTIMVGEPTWLRLEGICPGVCVGELALRGKQARLAVYRIDSAAGGISQSGTTARMEAAGQ